MLVYNETLKQYTDFKDTIRAVVSIHDGIIEFGFCSKDDSNLIISRICIEGFGEYYILKNANTMRNLIYSNIKGRYVLKNNLSIDDIIKETNTLGRGGFPYSFVKEYEAVNCFDLFKNKQHFINEKIDFALSKYLKYSFGVEFETYSGYIPEDICYRDGLIPLRDGSLDGGIEYSTIVLKGNDGLNLLKQQIDTLREYTYFNKECSLHFHFGGYPVNSISIWTLYLVWRSITSEIKNYVPYYTFVTSEYKKSHKDYCKQLPAFNSFNQLYTYVAGQKYFGSLTQPHPADAQRRAKWNCASRYHELNLLNMLCYQGPKTVEFRFLRPTFNFHKILLWIYVFNAILQYSENLSKNIEDLDSVYKTVLNTGVNLDRIIYSVYPFNIASIISNDLVRLKVIIENQTNLNDYIGSITSIEDKLLDPNIII